MTVQEAIDSQDFDEPAKILADILSLPDIGGPGERCGNVYSGRLRINEAEIIVCARDPRHSGPHWSIKGIGWHDDATDDPARAAGLAAGRRLAGNNGAAEPAKVEAARPDLAAIQARAAATRALKDGPGIPWLRSYGVPELLDDIDALLAERAGWERRADYAAENYRRRNGDALRLEGEVARLTQERDDAIERSSAIENLLVEELGEEETIEFLAVLNADPKKAPTS